MSGDEKYPGVPELKIRKQAEKDLRKQRRRDDREAAKKSAETYRDATAKLRRAQAIATEIKTEQTWVDRLRKRREHPSADLEQIDEAIEGSTQKVVRLLRESKALGYPILIPQADGTAIDPLDAEDREDADEV